MDHHLTKRQRAFIEAFVQLATANQHPIHYSQMANHLSVSPTTAYEMLRMLERKGLVATSYVLEEPAGRGRSTVLFVPTERARRNFETRPMTHRVDWGSLAYAFMSGNRTDANALIEVIHPLIEGDASFQLCFTVVIDALQLTLEYVARYEEYWLHLKNIVLSDSVLVYLPGAVLMLLHDPLAIRQKLEHWNGYQPALAHLSLNQQEELIQLIRSSLYLDEDEEANSTVAPLEDYNNDE